jgi:hypothetical protein
MTEGPSAERSLDDGTETNLAAAIGALIRRAREKASLSQEALGEKLGVTTPEPPLPPGEYARVEIMGHDYHTGWVSDGERAGVKVMVIRDWDGRVLAEVPGQSLYKFVPLPTPLKRPDKRAAIEAPGGSDDYLWDREPF